MAGENFNALASFAAVAEEKSFTRAAARLGISQSALSQAVSGLEARLGLKLLARTTRSVAPTDAGHRLLRTLRPAFDEIQAEMAALSSLRETPPRKIRITTSQHAAEIVLWPAIERFMAACPDVDVELSIDAEARDILVDKFDAGVRLGRPADKDLTSVRISADLRAVAVASPEYLRRCGVPQSSRDLTGHESINFRIPAPGGLNAFDLESHGDGGIIRMENRFASNDTNLVLRAALSGFGIAFMLEDVVMPHIASGGLVRILDDWSPVCPGYFFCYPSRRPASPAFMLLVDVLRQNAP